MAARHRCPRPHPPGVRRGDHEPVHADLILDELAGLPVISPDGGWSLLLDAAALGTDARTLSRRLLEHGPIAATPMTAWGPQAAPAYVRLVYSREPVSRLAGLRARVETAVAA